MVKIGVHLRKLSPHGIFLSMFDCMLIMFCVRQAKYEQNENTIKHKTQWTEWNIKRNIYCVTCATNI